MAQRTYDARVLVLRKTKLGESDLILTLMAEDGRQIRAVAKGARKPTSSFASRLELFSLAQVMLVQGRSLDIVKEVHLLDAHAPLRSSYELGAAAAPILELLSHVTQDDLPVERLFPMTQAALSALEQAPLEAAPLISCAQLLKCASLIGFRPSLSMCVECGAERGQAARVAYSAEAGGYLCGDCAVLAGVPLVDAALLDWADALIRSTFAQVAEMHTEDAINAELVRFTGTWLAAHIATIKSLPFAARSAG